MTCGASSGLCWFSDNFLGLGDKSPGSADGPFRLSKFRETQDSAVITLAGIPGSGRTFPSESCLAFEYGFRCTRSGLLLRRMLSGQNLYRVATTFRGCG